jgi:hypothetical protein
VKMKEEILSDIERINVVILVVGAVAAIFIMREFRYVFSFAVASAIMTLNFRFLRKILEGAFSAVEIKKKGLVIKLPLKFFALFTLIILVIVYGDIDIVFFLLGLSTVFLSTVMSQVLTVFSSHAERSK